MLPNNMVDACSLYFPSKKGSAPDVVFVIRDLLNIVSKYFAKLLIVLSTLYSQDRRYSISLMRKPTCRADV